MRPRTTMLPRPAALLLLALLTLFPTGPAWTQTARTDIACDPAERDDNPSCALGARCIRIAQDCGIWASFCSSGTDLLDACKLFCRVTTGRCELSGAACTTMEDCRGRGECREGRCMSVQVVRGRPPAPIPAPAPAAGPRAGCRNDAQCAGGETCIAGACGRSCRPGVSNPCPDGEGCLAGRCVPL